jgi:hypothetical protein
LIRGVVRSTLVTAEIKRSTPRHISACGCVGRAVDRAALSSRGAESGAGVAAEEDKANSVAAADKARAGNSGALAAGSSVGADGADGFVVIVAWISGVVADCSVVVVVVGADSVAGCADA